jgi:hypothetical protein
MHGTLEGIKETARKAFADHTREVTAKNEENVLFLQKRIM